MIHMTMTDTIFKNFVRERNLKPGSIKVYDHAIKKYIEYTGEEQTVTVYWDVEEYLAAGTYNVYIFADGVMIGSNSFNLK